MALPSYFYQDPMLVLEQKQQHALKTSCNGCQYSYSLQFSTELVSGCEKGQVFGKRCKYYQEIK